jgi:hypothetical protein
MRSGLSLCWPAALLLALLAVPAPPAAVAATTSGAGTAGRESFRYEPPERTPRGERTRYVDEAPDIVFQELWAFLEEQGLALESVDPQARLIVARYSGDPRPYLDCGKVQALSDGKPMDPPRVYSANKAEIRSARTIKGKRYGLLRQLRLDARLVIRVEPRGEGARVFSRATFVASQQLRRLRRGGVPDELVRREVISFPSSEPGRFAKGTTCISTGKLEDLPLQRFRKTS